LAKERHRDVGHRGGQGPENDQEEDEEKQSQQRVGELLSVEGFGVPLVQEQPVVTLGTVRVLPEERGTDFKAVVALRALDFRHGSPQYGPSNAVANYAWRLKERPTFLAGASLPELVTHPFSSTHCVA
jgi:hypothetical protein